MSNAFLNFLNQFNTLSEESICAIEENSHLQNFSKGTILLKEGKVCDSLYYIQKGCVRGTHEVDGKEITYWFGFEDTMVTSFHSFISGKPANETIILMEDTAFTVIRKENLEKLYNLYPDIDRTGRLITEKYYVMLEERTFSYMFKTAKERYENLLVSAPHILQRVPLGYIASYLGITQETLSRIRKM